MAEAQRGERPILFSAPMVRAILAGTKTQTRRAVKPQPDITGMHTQDGEGRSWGPKDVEYRTHDAEHYLSIPGASFGPMRCPYGTLGDRLWVRETWAPYDEKTIRDRELDGIFYRADDEQKHETDGAWRSPIHMPRWASRLTLEVTGIRVERLHGISPEDALAEGVRAWEESESREMAAVLNMHDPRDAYAQLWESINGLGSWDANPWVWVIEFRRCDVPAPSGPSRG